MLNSEMEFNIKPTMYPHASLLELLPNIRGNNVFSATDNNNTPANINTFADHNNAIDNTNNNTILNKETTAYTYIINTINVS